MKTSKSILAIAMALSFAAFHGCDKDDNISVSIAKVKTANYYLQGIADDVTATYTYDAQGRVTEIAYTGALNSVTTFTYNGNTVIRQRNGENFSTTYALDARGNATSVTIKDTANNILSTQNYTYDSNEHLTFDGYYTYAWSEDNRVSQIAPGDTTTFTFLTDKTNTIGNHNMGFNFYGEDSKNLINTSVAYGDATPMLYEYDSEDRVTKVIASDTTTYTYY